MLFYGLVVILNCVSRMDWFVLWDLLLKMDIVSYFIFSQNAHAQIYYFWWLSSCFTILKRVCTRTCKILLDSIVIFFFLWKLFSVYFNDLPDNCSKTCFAVLLWGWWPLSCGEKWLWMMTGSLVSLVKNLSFCVSQPFINYEMLSAKYCMHGVLLMVLLWQPGRSVQLWGNWNNLYCPQTYLCGLFERKKMFNLANW